MSAQIPCDMICKWLFVLEGRRGRGSYLFICYYPPSVRQTALESTIQYYDTGQICSHYCSIVYSITIYTKTYILLGKSY